MTLLSIPALPINTGLRTLFAKTFRELARGTRAMILGTFIVWQESRNYGNDCYFCVAQTLVHYLNLRSTVFSVPHSVDVNVLFLKYDRIH